MTVLSLLPPPLADIALTHSLHHDRFIEFMAISVIESIKLILRGVAFKMGVVLEVGVVRLRGKKSPPFQILDPPLNSAGRFFAYKKVDLPLVILEHACPS